MKPKPKRTTAAAALLLLAALGAASCGPPFKGRVSVDEGAHPYIDIGFVDYTYWVDDHRRSRKGADHIFDIWAATADLDRSVTGKRLLSIAPTAQGCYLTYDYATTTSRRLRVTLVVDPYRKAYRKDRHADGAAIDWPHLRPGMNRLHRETDSAEPDGGRDRRRARR